MPHTHHHTILTFSNSIPSTSRPNLQFLFVLLPLNCTPSTHLIMSMSLWVGLIRNVVCCFKVRPRYHALSSRQIHHSPSPLKPLSVPFAPRLAGPQQNTLQHPILRPPLNSPKPSHQPPPPFPPPLPRTNILNLQSSVP
jgi:hypothetical protein